MATIWQQTQKVSSEIMELNLSSNKNFKIHKIENLTKFKNLQILILTNHMIKKIQNLQTLMNLKIINLEFNQIQILENISNLHKLQQLYLSYNSIRLIQLNIAKLPIKILHLAYNQLNVQQLIPLSKLKYLLVLSVHGNPLVQQFTYHNMIGIILQKLVILDQKQIKRLKIKIQTQQTQLLKKQLNQVIKQKNILAQKLQKRKKTQSLEDIIPQKDAQQTRFYIQALKSQNKILQTKIIELEEQIQKLSAKYKGKKSQNQQKILKLAQILQKKYKQSLSLQKKLAILNKTQDLNQKQEKQKQQILKAIKQNELVIKNYYKKLTKLKQQQSKLFLQFNNNQKSNIQQIDTTQRNLIAQQINQYQQQISKYKQKWEQNHQLINKYTAKLNKLNNNIQLILIKIIYGDLQQLDFQTLNQLYQKYQIGLINIINNLMLLIFGQYVQYQKIQELRKQLYNKPLIEFILQKNVSKNKDKKRQQRFLRQKQNFLNEFEKQTKELAHQWQMYSEEKQKFEKEIKQKREVFYRQLQQKMKEQERKHDKKIRQKEEKIEELELDYKNKIKEYKEQIEEYMKRIEEYKGEYRRCEIQFENKFDQLQEFEDHFKELKQEKNNLLLYKNEIDKLKLDIQNKNEQIQLKNKDIKQLNIEEQLIKDRIVALQKKSKQKLNQLLQIDQKYKQHTDKLTSIILQYNRTIAQLDSKNTIIQQLDFQIKQFQKNIQRSKNNFNMWQSKLQNLSILEASKKQSFQSLEIQILKKQQILKQKQKLYDDLTFKKQKILQQIHVYQIKLSENKSSLQSLTSLNNAISKMSIHQKQLKSSLLQLEILIQNKSKIKFNLEQDIKQLQIQQTNLLQRINKIRKI